MPSRSSRPPGPAEPLRSVVVTGVSTGIGRSIAADLLRRGLRVFGSVRRASDGEALGKAFAKSAGAFVPLHFDVVDEAAVRSEAARVRDRLDGEILFGLVNNAGVAIAGPLLHQPVAEFRQQLEVNTVGPFLVTQAFAPLLGAELAPAPSIVQKNIDAMPKPTSRKGRVVNLSSVGGKLAPPFLGGYAASKHALEGYSDSLRRELMIYGVDVVVIGPGSVVTPIWDKAETAPTAQYDQTVYKRSIAKFRDFFIADGRRGHPPQKIADVVWEALSAPSPKTRYAVVPRPFSNWTLPRMLPVRTVDNLLARTFGLDRSPPHGRE